MKFRLTTGENGSKFGKQTVIYSDNAENAIEFLQAILKRECPDARYTKKYKEIRDMLNNCWVDAGENTLPIDVSNIVF